MILIGEAYKLLKDTKTITSDWNEENISANIVTNINDNDKAYNYRIIATDESRIYTSDILDNKKSAKSASRIDIRLSTWNGKIKSFYVEAKNLIENNCPKKGRKTLLNATKIIERYITTGIDHFLLGDYPSNGCMLGYIVEGKISKIAEKINLILLKSTREEEILKKIQSNTPHLDDVFISTHLNGYILYHYFLNFSQNN